MDKPHIIVFPHGTQVICSRHELKDCMDCWTGIPWEDLLRGMEGGEIID